MACFDPPDVNARKTMFHNTDTIEKKTFFFVTKDKEAQMSLRVKPFQPSQSICK